MLKFFQNCNIFFEDPPPPSINIMTYSGQLDHGLSFATTFEAFRHLLHIEKRFIKLIFRKVIFSTFVTLATPPGPRAGIGPPLSYLEFRVWAKIISPWGTATGSQKNFVTLAFFRGVIFPCFFIGAFDSFLFNPALSCPNGFS